MDQASLERLELYEPVSCETYDRLLVHYATREAPHADYKQPVLCKLTSGLAVVGWILSHVDGESLIELRAGMGLDRLIHARLDWIALITFVRVL